MKYASLIAIICLVPGMAYTQARDSKFLTDKTGKFILQNQLNKCQGTDVASLSKNLTAIAEWIRQSNPVMFPPTGFEAAVSLSGNLCDKGSGTLDFGIRSRISISFRYFYYDNGVSHTATDWAAHGTEILINNPIVQISTQFTETGFQNDDLSRLKQPLEKALKNLERFYASDPVEKEIAPGVRLYAGGHILIFNPDRPDIWIAVTVKEIMAAKLEYYKIKQEIDSARYEKTLVEWAKLNFKPDQVMRPNIYNVIKKEFENFTDDELNLPAYSSPQSGISGINAYGKGRPVTRFNTASWNRSLPAAAVQFISMEYKPRSNKEFQEFKQNNAGLIDYVGLFTNNLLVEKMDVLIQRK